MPSRTIRPTEAPTAAPFAYTIGTAEGIAPQAVSVLWDGSGAPGDFLPCVSYYSAEGVLLDRAFPDNVTLHPGDSAEVSYRPFRRGGPGPPPTPPAPLDTTDGVTSVSPTTQLTIDGGLHLAAGGPGEAILSATPPATTLVYTSAYVVSQTSPSAAGVNGPRLFLTQMYGNGITYGVSPSGNHGTTLGITLAGLYRVSYNIAGFFTPFSTSPAILSFGPDGGTWNIADLPYPFAINDRAPLAFAYSDPAVAAVRSPVGGTVDLHLAVGETLSFGLGSDVVGINVTVHRGLFSLVKVG